jgi:hypothetical protein
MEGVGCIIAGVRKGKVEILAKTEILKKRGSDTRNTRISHALFPAIFFATFQLRLPFKG